MSVGGKKSKKAKQQVVDYYMSIHFGVAAGPLDAVLGIYVNEKEAWTGNVTSESDITVNRTDLFGGPKSEGGVKGNVRYLPGDVLQTMPDSLAARFGLTSATCPGFRGLSTMFFRGDGVNPFPGFLWSTNSPYLPPVWIRCQRSPKGMDPEKAMIGPDANPAHMIYECLVNDDWGMGASAEAIDDTSFEAAADLFIDEALGLSMLWTQQATVQEFVNEILNHVQATLFVDPRTGLITLKPIRGDYDADTLPILTPDNCKVLSWQDRAWGETINEIVVTWTNPTNEEEETVSLQDLGNIAMQGAIVSDGRNYYGVRNKDLAAKLAARDLRVAAAPLASCEVEASRAMGDLVPGSVVKLTYPEHGATESVMRVQKIDYGRPGEPAIKISLVEDIFTLPVSEFISPPSSAFVDQSEEPRPIDYVEIITMPYYVVVALGEDLDYPEVISGVLAAQTGLDTVSFELLAETVLPNGSTALNSVGNRTLVGRATLSAPLSAEAISTNVNFANLTRGTVPVVAGFAFIGSGGDEGMELVLLDTQSISGWTLWRGVLDTVPRAWPAGTPVWFVSADTSIEDDNIRAGGESVDYKVLPRTSRGRLAEEDADLLSATLSDRPHLPSRPANFKIGATGFGTAAPAAEMDVTTSWARRNRLTEDSQVLRWTDGDVTPEDGQTTVLRVYTLDGELLATHDDIAGTSFEVPYASFDSRSRGRVQAVATRDGLESLQGHSIDVAFTGLPTGYGYDYGYSYGVT